MNKKKSFYVSIKKRRYRLIGHSLRHEGPTRTILEGTLEGRKKKGRQRLEYVKQIIGDVGCSG